MGKYLLVGQMLGSLSPYCVVESTNLNSDYDAGRFDLVN
jgi:hypothetical protein